MIELNCSSLESAQRSVAALLDIDSSDLRRRLASFHYEDVDSSIRRLGPYEHLLVEQALELSPDSLPQPDSVVWFHGTRVPPDTTFQDGLLPLSKVIERVWDLLGRLAAEMATIAQWREFRESMEGNAAQQYFRKIGHRDNEGPFGFLVRENLTAIDHDGALHDFLSVPELVEDICAAYQEMYGLPLLNRFRDATTPCIVSFRTGARPADDVLAAITYLHCQLRHVELRETCQTGYSANGETIPFANIVDVEWFEGGL